MNHVIISSGSRQRFGIALIRLDTSLLYCYLLPAPKGISQGKAFSKADGRHTILFKGTRLAVYFPCLPAPCGKDYPFFLKLSGQCLSSIINSMQGEVQEKPCLPASSGKETQCLPVDGR